MSFHFSHSGVYLLDIGLSMCVFPCFPFWRLPLEHLFLNFNFPHSGAYLLDTGLSMCVFQFFPFWRLPLVHWFWGLHFSYSGLHKNYLEPLGANWNCLEQFPGFGSYSKTIYSTMTECDFGPLLAPAKGGPPSGRSILQQLQVF